ncbi:hypothetical protein GY26_11165 [Gammaproteobacteria bacterium MFB021]|nr:hypothetical protein GY26_11165 [Gammaproteobacteria bacterium MFB021]
MPESALNRPIAVFDAGIGSYAIVAGLGEGTPGSGRIRALVTEDERYSLADFQRMLARLGVELPLEKVA